MSDILIAAILALCPGSDLDHKGQVITTSCQEWMTNCMINEAGNEEPTQKQFDSCSSKHRDKIRRGSKIVSSDVSDD